jgi:serine/threonine protein kinase
VAAPSAQDSQELDRLIATVQQPRPPDTSPLATDGKIDPVPLDQFLACLSKSGLSNEEQIASWLRDIAPDTSLALANALVEQGALTALQARALLRGRWRGLVLGNYVVLEKLGQGGMGQVFRARDRYMQRDVCIKVLHPKGQRTPDHVERFRREAKAVASLDHPNIVVAHDAGEAESIHYLVMELVQGSDLAKWVATHGPLHTDVAVRYVLQAATALAYAHGRGVIHRDIKPHNLFLDESGNIKILDLGLARIDAVFQSDGEDALSTMTKTGMVVGTVDYIAPEQAVDARHADYRSDLYSLGCTLHYLLTGRAVYPGETLMARLVAHREEPIPSLANSIGDISPRLDAIFQKMIAKHPSDRYQSMTELVRDLQAWQRGEKPIALAQPPIQHPIPLEPVDETPQVDDTLASYEASTLDMPSPATLPRRLPATRRRRRFEVPRRVLLGAAIGGASLAGIVLLYIAGSVMMPALSERLASGGAARAVVVLPPHKFKSADYQAVMSALESQRVSYVVVSSNKGEAQGDDGAKVNVDLSFADYEPRATDVVILCGGHDLHEVKKSQVADRALQKGAVIFPVGNGFDVVYPQYKQAAKAAGRDWDEKFSGGEAICAGNGTITKACTPKDLPAVMQHALTELVAR